MDLFDMSFPTFASYPKDKSSEMFNQGVEELGNDFFDQFLNFNSHDGETTNHSTLPESTYMETRNNHSTGLSLSLTEDKRHPYLWTGESWIFPPNISTQPGESKQFYTEFSGRAAISDSELLSLERITLDTPNMHKNTQSSLPSSPSLTATLEKQQRKNRIVTTLSETFKKPHKSFDKTALRSPIRKANNSPKAGRAQQNNHNSLESWKGKSGSGSSNFSFELPQNSLPLSPPPSAKASDASMNSKRVDGKELNGFDNRISSAQSVGQPAGYHTPVRTPRSDSHQAQRTPSLQRSNTVTFPSNNQFLSTVRPEEVESPIWWSHTSTPIAQPSPSLLHNNSQHASRTLAMQLQNEATHYNNGNEMGFSHMHMGINMNSHGLTIHMPPSSIQQSYVMSTPPMIHQQGGYFPPQCRAAGRAPRSQQQGSPRRKHRTPSPPSDSASPSSPSLRVRKRKSAKSLGAKKPGMIDFVNFTPDDSRKILTGVAPSGSSKTKARREKEAEDKRRKLSQAALRAVKAAGGDVKSLVEEGLFV